MREEAEKRIGYLYPKIEITPAMANERIDLKALVGKKLTVIAWLWARTVKSPSPAFSEIEVPLVSSFVLSAKEGKGAWVEPIVSKKHYDFILKFGKPPKEALEGTKVGRGGHFRCVMSGSAIHVNYIREQGKLGKIGQRLMAVVAEGPKGRCYLPAIKEMETIAKNVTPLWSPENDINYNPRDIRPQLYGLTKYADLFTSRQLIVLTCFADIISEVREKVLSDAGKSEEIRDEKGLEDGGNGTKAYAEAICLYLAFVIDKMADLGNNLVAWEPIAQCPRHLFSRQAIPMTWDFAEPNPFSDSSGSWEVFLEGITKAFSKAFENTSSLYKGFATQANAIDQVISSNMIISTDPPYYDNIAYADLSDFFYIWLRRSLKSIFPTLFSTLAVPKAEELVATPYRHNDKDSAEKFFLEGMTKTMNNLVNRSHPSFPVTIYYAFKQSETKGEGTSSTGWEIFLEAVIKAGFEITGTWPMRTENASRMVSQGANVFASSIVFVCKKKDKQAFTVSRRDFIRELNISLPEALDEMTRGGVNSPVAPVDLSQSMIGPGMAIFSKYTAVLEADGKPMTVRTALQLINRFFSEDDFDHETQFCLHWFESFGWGEDKFGEADVLARAKGTSVESVKDAGVLESKGGKVRLFKFIEYPQGWKPKSDKRTPVWEALHYLIKALNSGGEKVAGEILAPMITKSESIRQLSYRLYTVCERKGWAEDARAYNDLITSWQAIESASNEVEKKGHQEDLFNTGDKDVTKTLA